MSPLELGLIELPTRPRSEYTQAIRRAAIMEADGGRLQGAADLTRAAMTEDSYARGVLGGLAYGLWGLSMNFIGDPEMIAALTDTPKGAGQWRTMFPQPEAIRLFSWGATLGVGLGQMRKRWRAPGEEVVSVEEAENGAYKIRLPERPIGAHDTRVLRAWDPKYLRNQWWDDSWFLMTADGEIRIEPNDGEWVLYTPYGAVKPWEYGAWKALTLAYVIGRDALFDRSRHAEVLAPVRVGTVPAGTTETQRKKFMAQIRMMQRMHQFVLPPGLDYKIVESSHKIGDIYDNIIGWAERGYCLIFTGNETSTTGSKGFSSGDVQERIAKHVLKSYSVSLSDCLHDGGLVEWSLENYGTTDAPRAGFDCDPPEDKKTKAETLKTAGEALTAWTSGLKEAANLKPTEASVIKFAQSFGFEVEQLPSLTTLPKIDVTPTAREYAYTLGEVRASDGYGPMGPADPNDRNTMTIADAEAAAKAAAPGGNHGDVNENGPLADVALDVDEAPPQPDHAAILAEKMTTHAEPRCEHGSNNRCWKCGVERTRDFIPGKRGQPSRWIVAWRPIARTANGAASRPLFGEQTEGEA